MDIYMKMVLATVTVLVISLAGIAGHSIGKYNAGKAAITKYLPLPMRTQMYSFGHSEEFKTVDGMPCVVFTNDKGAGLSCDWSTRETVPGTD
jgi:hypothetical protein